MKRFFSWLIKPAVLSLLGVLLLSLVVWFEAPLLAFDGRAPFASADARWTIIAILFLAWAAVHAWRALRVHRASTALLRSVAGEDAPAAAAPAGAAESAAELALINKRMQDAVALLRKTGAGGRKGGLYHLPWYLFIGAPGAGKTTALVHSGLKFPLAESMGTAAIGGVGGYRS